VWLAAGAGLREGEALGLVLPRVEFLARRLNVMQQVQGGVLSPLKTRASKRLVPVDDLVLTKINEHMATWPPGPWQLLITGRTRKPVRRNAFGERWRLAVAGAGLPMGTRFHALRHFYASVQIARRAQPEGTAGPARARDARRDDGHLLALVAGQRGARARRH
jgi:integrase